MKSESGGWERIAAIALSIAGATVGLYRFFPAQDGPEHLLTFHLVRELQNPDSPLHAFFYSRLAGHWTYVGMERCVLALGHLLPLAVADRMMVFALLVGFPLAIVFFLGRVNPGARLNLLAAPVLGLNWLFHMGFWNLLLGYTLALLTLGLLLPRLASLRARDLVLGGVLLLVLAAIHPFALAFALGVLGLTALLAPVEGSRLRVLAGLALATLPAALLVVKGLRVDLRDSEAMPGDPVPAFQWSSLASRLEYFFARIFFSSRPLALVLYGLLALALGVAIGRALASRVDRTVSGRLSLRFGRSDAMLAVATSVLVGYLVLPHQIGRTVSFVADRLAVLVVVLFLGWLPPPRRAARGVGVLLAFAAALLIVESHLYVRQWNGALAEFTSGADHVPVGARILPMVFDTTGEVKTFAFPIIEAWAYYAVERDAISPYSFAANPQVAVGYVRSAFLGELPHHGLYFAEEAQRSATRAACDTALLDDADHYDYALLWRAPGDFLALAAARGFSQAFVNGRLILLRPPGRGDPPPLLGAAPEPATPSW